MKAVAIWVLISLGIVATGIFIYPLTSPALNVHN